MQHSELRKIHWQDAFSSLGGSSWCLAVTSSALAATASVADLGTDVWERLATSDKCLLKVICLKNP